MASSREFCFIGSVQGVGFRWTVKRLAEAIGVTGWVKNNPDGSVTLVIAGSDAEIDRLLDGVTERFGSYIQKVTSREIDSPRPSGGFEIVR